jgi:D-serine transporter
MHAQIWVVSTLLISIVLIVLTIVKFKFHPFLALLLASFFVGAMMGMGRWTWSTRLKTESAER